MSPTEQRVMAARRGATVRLARSADRRRMCHGTLKLSDVIEDPPEHWHATLLYAALLMIPKFGRHKLRAFNAAAVRQGVNVCAPVGDLAPLQRAWTVAYLRERGL